MHPFHVKYYVKEYLSVLLLVSNCFVLFLFCFLFLFFFGGGGEITCQVSLARLYFTQKDKAYFYTRGKGIPHSVY